MPLAAEVAQLTSVITNTTTRTLLDLLAPKKNISELTSFNSKTNIANEARSSDLIGNIIGGMNKLQKEMQTVHFNLNKENQVNVQKIYNLDEFLLRILKWSPNWLTEQGKWKK